MKTILLSSGKVALVDDEDYELVNKRVWSARQSKRKNGKSTWYAYASIRQDDGSVKIVQLHNYLMNCKPIDHKDGDGLNCQRSNLRHCTYSQNSMNSRPRGGRKYKGIGIHKAYQKWRAYISVNNKQKHIGYYNNPEDAARAYNEAAKKYHGEFARLNEV